MSAGTKLFVYGVNRSCPKDILEDKFGKMGSVTDVYITEKGYAFVTMADENDARAAVDELNGANVDGQEIKVEMAHGRGSNKPRGGNGSRGRGAAVFGERRGGGFGGDRRGGAGGGNRFGGGRFGGEGGGYRGGRGYGSSERRGGSFVYSGDRRDDRRVGGGYGYGHNSEY